MSDVVVQKAAQLTDHVRTAIETALGRRVEPDEEVSIMAFRPHGPPPPHEREVLTRQLEHQMDEMAARVKDVPDEELDQILDEAMRHVRPSYRRSE